jgi:hypothetical protein
MNLTEDNLEVGRKTFTKNNIKTASGCSPELVPSIFPSHGQFA